MSRKRTETDQNIERKSENEEFGAKRALRLRQFQLKNQISVSGEEIKIFKVEIR
jgi:hypothetical protein